MIITIQKSTRGYLVTFTDFEEFENKSLQRVTKEIGYFSDEYFAKMGTRPTIKILPIKHTPMAMKSKVNKLKKAVAAKAKKAVKKPTKK